MTDPTVPMTDKKLREAVNGACRELVRRGLSYGTSGNVSVRRDERHFFVSPTGMPYEAMESDDIPLVDDRRPLVRPPPSVERMALSSRHITGPAMKSQPSFIPIPRRRRPSRAPAEEFLPSITWSRLRVAPTSVVRRTTHIGTQELSDAAVAALAGRKACLLANHGVIAVGADLPAALALAGEVENLAAQYCTALCYRRGPHSRSNRDAPSRREVPHVRQTGCDRLRSRLWRRGYPKCDRQGN